MKLTWLHDWFLVMLLMICIINTALASVDTSVETLDSSGQPDRVFKSGDNISIRTILRNTGTSTVAGNLQLQIKDENDNLIENLPSQYISIASNEQKVVESTWNSGNHAEGLSPGGFTFIGKKFKVSATFGISSSNFDFYIDEFGLDRSLRSMNYYSMQLDWWEDVWGKVKERVNNGENVRDAWRNEWMQVISHAKSTGANVFDIGMHWYSYGDDEACGMVGCKCGDNSKPLSYWFPASEDGESYYSTPPMYPSVRRMSFQDLGISDIETARQMIRNISDIAHSHVMKVAVYLDSVGLLLFDF